MRAILLAAALAMSVVSSCLAWDGYDWDSGSFVEIDKGNLVRPGRDIQIYDYGMDGGFKDVQVQDVYRFGSRVVVEVYDYETGESRTLDMEGAH